MSEQEYINVRKLLIKDSLNELIDMYAKSEGFHSFEYLRSLTQSVNAIHAIYVDSIYYVIESLIDEGVITINKEVVKQGGGE